MADLMRRRPNAVGRRYGWPFGRVFEDLMQGLEDVGLPEPWNEGRFSPAIDVKEDDSSVTITAEVPGMEKDDLDVTVENRVLTISGEKKEEKATEKENYHRVERRYGRFERSIRLPDYVDTEQVEASYKGGVLNLSMPKIEAAKSKSIEVK